MTALLVVLLANAALTLLACLLLARRIGQTNSRLDHAEVLLDEAANALMWLGKPLRHQRRPRRVS